MKRRKGNILTRGGKIPTKGMGLGFEGCKGRFGSWNYVQKWLQKQVYSGQQKQK